MYPSHSSASMLSDIFETGNFTTQLQMIDSAVHFPPPKPLLIATPLEAGHFPLLLFLHGYLLFNCFYSQLILHVASHGFIVIAPQLYILAGSDTSNEIHSAAAVTNWLGEGLSKYLPPNVKPNYNKLALGGHSRGGKTAFAVALKKLNTTTNLKFSALIGIDPVDGTDKGKQTPPPVLTYVPHSFDFDMAALVIGSELGEQRNPLFPPCAPKGVNHKDFFDECPKRSWHFVAGNYGHLDMLDDAKGVIGKFTCLLCKNGDSRKPMRRFVGGATVAFLKAYLLADYRDLIAIRDGHLKMPLNLTTNECYV